jgi:hypothetical protein
MQIDIHQLPTPSPKNQLDRLRVWRARDRPCLLTQIKQTEPVKVYFVLVLRGTDEHAPAGFQRYLRRPASVDGPHQADDIDDFLGLIARLAVPNPRR